MGAALGAISGIGSAVGAISSMFGGSSASSAGGDGGVGAAEAAQLKEEQQMEVDQINTQMNQDKMQSAAQQSTSWANTMNTIAKEFMDSSQAKETDGSQVAKASSDEAKQA